MAEKQDMLLEHFLHPRNVSIIENADGYSRGKNPVNGYITDMYLRIENDAISDIKYKTYGCVVTIAVASGLSCGVKGKTLSYILDSEDTYGKLSNLITNEIGEIKEKNWHCVPTVIQTLLTAILDFYQIRNNDEKIRQIKKIIKDINLKIENRKNNHFS